VRVDALERPARRGQDALPGRRDHRGDRRTRISARPAPDPGENEPAGVEPEPQRDQERHRLRLDRAGQAAPVRADQPPRDPPRQSQRGGHLRTVMRPGEPADPLCSRRVGAVR